MIERALGAYQRCGCSVESIVRVSVSEDRCVMKLMVGVKWKCDFLARLGQKSLSGLSRLVLEPRLP